MSCGQASRPLAISLPLDFKGTQPDSERGDLRANREYIIGEIGVWGGLTLCSRQTTHTPHSTSDRHAGQSLSPVDETTTTARESSAFWRTRRRRRRDRTPQPDRDVTPVSRAQPRRHCSRVETTSAMSASRMVVTLGRDGVATRFAVVLLCVRPAGSSHGQRPASRGPWGTDRSKPVKMAAGRSKWSPAKMTGLIKIRPACLPIGDPARMARGPLPWDPSDTRGNDPDSSCLPHALLSLTPFIF